MTAGVAAEGGVEVPDAALAVRADEIRLAAGPRDAEHPRDGDALNPIMTTETDLDRVAGAKQIGDARPSQGS